MQAAERTEESIYLFTIMHPERYRSLDTYRSKRPEYRELVRRLVPEDWEVGEEPGIWSMASPPQRYLPEAGFKIHLSITPDNARALLEAIVPILAVEQVCFKVLVDEGILEIRNSHHWGRSGAGKFVTIYPRDIDQFKSLVRRLYDVTGRFVGPRIMSDKPYKDSKILSYCYGSCRKQRCVSIYGGHIPLLKTPEGRQIAEPHLPYFDLPEGVTDPFPDGAVDEEEPEPILRDRYKAIYSFGFSAKGGIYKCMDLQSHKEVIVKEGRPFVSRGRRCRYDAVDCLKNEYRALKLLEDTGLTPRPIEFFQEWDHHFLIMELAPGESLSDYFATGKYCLAFERVLSADGMRKYGRQLVDIARKIVAGMRAIHARNIVIQDISPRNILFDPEQGKITFIDFEAAYFKDGEEKSPLIPLCTPGYGAARPHDQEPTVNDDYRALSNILGSFIAPCMTFFALAPEKKQPMLTHIAKEKGLPDAFVKLALGGAEQPEQIEQLIDAAEQSIASITAVAPPPPLRSDDELRVIVDGIGSYILTQIHEADPLDLPTDHRRFITNRLSVSYGAAGIALFLKRTRKELPPIFTQALCREAGKISNGSYPPGLYVGSSGVAWTLLELGLRSEAEAIMDTAVHSPLLYEKTDMFYGAAGWGLVNLFFFRRTGDEKYLRNAVKAFDQIKGRLQKEKEGYSCKSADEFYFGLGHGGSGIGYFVLRLYQVTAHKEHLKYARGLLGFEIAKIQEYWGQGQAGDIQDEQPLPPYWRSGSAGLGSILLRYHAVLKDERYMQMARRVAGDLPGRYAVIPTNFYGMAGIANFFVDMYQYTGEEAFLSEARRYVDRIMLYALEKPAGIVFPGEDLLRIATDYGTGSAGVGVFIHRILTGDGIPYMDF